MCDRCVSTLFDGNSLDIPIEDGSVLHVNGCDVCGCDGEYTLSKLNKISGKNCVKYGYSSGNIRENKMRFV